MKTVEQQIADAELKLQRLKNKRRKLETGQKVILGGQLLAKARTSKAHCKLAIELLQDLERDADIKRAEPLINQLQIHLQNMLANETPI